MHAKLVLVLGWSENMRFDWHVINRRVGSGQHTMKTEHLALRCRGAVTRVQPEPAVSKAQSIRLSEV